MLRQPAGIREAGKSFAVPTYLFWRGDPDDLTGCREAFGTLGRYPYPVKGQYGFGTAHNYSSLISFALIFVLLRAFANGGSSLTGIEAVSNAVSAFRPPEGINARKVLVTEGLILGSLVAGISWLAHVTHAAPYTLGVPTVLSQEARIIFGHSALGDIPYILVQAATALILYTGGNTSFNGFPFLANFVAEDTFLPRWLTKRGHRLVFSNGIVVLAVLSCALLAAVGANVDHLVPFYAIGVFTAFTLAGFGMAKYHHTHREAHWQRKLVINFSAGVTSLVVVLIFVVVKFTEGAWLVVILSIIGVPALIRLNRSTGWRRGAGADRRPAPAARAAQVRPAHRLRAGGQLRPGHQRRAAVRPGPAPDELRAVHFVIDTSVPNGCRALALGRPPGPARPHRLPGPAGRPVRGRTGQRRSLPARDARHRGAAAAQLYPLSAGCCTTAPPTGSPRGQPDPEHDRHLVPFDVRSRIEVRRRQLAQAEKAALAGRPRERRRRPGRAGSR